MTAAPPPPIPRKTPRQARARATCAAILEAAARILEEEGARPITTNRVAERAGVSVGSLYQYFPNRDAILAELVRDMRRDMLADMEAAGRAARGRPLAEAVPLLVRGALAHHAGAPRRARLLEEVEAALPLDAETAALKRAIAALVVGILGGHGVPRPDEAAFDLTAMTRGMAEAAAAAGETDFDALSARIVRAALGYLGG